MGWATAAMMAAGALAGAQEKQSTLSVNAGQAGALENLAGSIGQTQLQQLSDLVGKGPGEAAVQQGMAGQQDFIKLLQQTLAQGGQPTQADMTQANTLAGQLFQPQQVAMQQQFQDQRQQAARQAAMLGRNISDPILQAKLAQEQSRQSAQLNAQMGSFATQQAMQQPMQRLNLGAQLAQAQASLANQAFANRQMLLQMGSAVRGQEQQFRMGTASKSSTEAGGLGGALAGGLAGLGTAIKPEFGTWAGGVGDWFSNTFGSNQGSNVQFAPFGSTLSQPQQYNLGSNSQFQFGLSTDGYRRP